MYNIYINKYITYLSDIHVSFNKYRSFQSNIPLEA